MNATAPNDDGHSRTETDREPQSPSPRVLSSRQRFETLQALKRTSFSRKLFYDDGLITGKWEELCGRIIPRDSVFIIISVYAFHNYGVLKISYDNDRGRNRRRVYKCHGCHLWYVTLDCVNPDEREPSKELYKVVYQEESVQIGKHGNSTHVPSVLRCLCGTRDYPKRFTMAEQTFVNLPLIRNLVRNGSSTQFSSPKLPIIFEKFGALGIPRDLLPNNNAMNNALSHLQIINILKKRHLYYDFPKYMTYFAHKNPTATIALQGDQHNQFYRLFVGFPIAKHHGKLTLAVLIADCFHFQTPHYDGVAIVIVSKTGFGRTIIHAFAIFPIEDTNNIAWFLQMCLRHGLDLDCALFTDQGPLLAAARILFEKFKLRFNLMLCLQHIFRNIRHKFKDLFPKKVVSNLSESFMVALHNASMAETMESFFEYFMQMVTDLVSVDVTRANAVVDMGLYILKFDPSHWTVFANTLQFSRDDYKEKLLKFVAHLFSINFLCRNYNPNDHNDLQSIIEIIAQSEALGNDEAKKWVPKDIFVNAHPCPRFNISKTNMAESIASLMLLIGCRYDIPPLAVFYFFQVYNKQVQLMASDYKAHFATDLSTIGHHVKYIITKAAQSNHIHDDQFRVVSSCDAQEIHGDKMMLESVVSTPISHVSTYGKDRANDLV